MSSILSFNSSTLWPILPIALKVELNVLLWPLSHSGFKEIYIQEISWKQNLDLTCWSRSLLSA